MGKSQRPLPGKTWQYLAPEYMCRPGTPAAPSADMFAYGRLCYVIVVGSAPVEALSNDTLEKAARSGIHIVLPWPPSVSPLLGRLRTVATLGMYTDVDERLSAREAQLILEDGVEDVN